MRRGCLGRLFLLLTVRLYSALKNLDKVGQTPTSLDTLIEQSYQRFEPENQSEGTEVPSGFLKDLPRRLGFGSSNRLTFARTLTKILRSQG